MATIKFTITYVAHVIFLLYSSDLGREKNVKYTIFSTVLYICNSLNKNLERKRNEIKIETFFLINRRIGVKV